MNRGVDGHYLMLCGLMRMTGFCVIISPQYACVSLSLPWG